MRREVVSLLEHSESGETVVAPAGAMPPKPEQGQRLERRIGPYQLLRRVGQGGQGAVYEAIRDDGNFHQRVAIKIVKWEIDSTAAQERFRRERQILAGLQHPYIARLLDGGETDDGTPYLVMEFVEGQPLTIAASDWPVRRKLELFLKVCQALEHAHRNLVIHRDLKPANILVTAEGEPKLLDFGIAKFIDPAATKTQTGMAALTPEYASPEQVRGLPISTLSDIYSLGVVLYQLLTNRKPYKLDTTSPFELERVICVESPAPPALGDELDHILLMALRKEPERRYPSVERFAEDIERYLNNEPVRARPDTLVYRTRKYVRRHWVGLAAASAALAGICIGAGIAVYQARVAQERFGQVRKLANTFLFEFNDEIANIPGTTRARSLVVRTALEYLGSLAKSAGGDIQLQAELASAYQKVGEVQGLPNTANLGDTKGAADSYAHAVSLYEQIVKRDPSYSIDFADCLRKLAFIKLYQHQVPEAHAAIEKALTQSKQFQDQHTLRALALMAAVSDTAGEIAREINGPPEYVHYAQQALHYREEWARLVPPADSVNSQEEVAVSHLRLGRAYMAKGDLSQAGHEMELCLQGLEVALQAQPHNLKYMRNRLATLLSLREVYGSGTGASLEQWDKGAKYGRRAVDACRQMMDADPNEANIRMNHAVALMGLAFDLAQASPGAGIPEAHEAIAAWRSVSASGKISPYDKSMALNNLRLIVPALARANHAEGIGLAQEVVDSTRGMLKDEPKESDSFWYLSDALVAQSEAARESGKIAPGSGVDRYLTEAIAVTKPFIGAADQSLATAMAASDLYEALTLGRIAAGRCAEASEWRAKEVATWAPVAPKSEFAARRMREAQADPPKCTGR